MGPGFTARNLTITQRAICGRANGVEYPRPSTARRRALQVQIARRATQSLSMRISVLHGNRSARAESRCAGDSVARLIKQQKLEVVVQRGAGLRACFRDEAYEGAGATLVADAGAAFAGAQVVAKVQPPSAAEIARIDPSAVVISLMRPGQSADIVAALAQRKITSLALELVPRITRAQSMDVLSSQSTVSGYKGVLIGASELGKFLPMLTTAAGNISPAKGLHHRRRRGRASGDRHRPPPRRRRSPRSVRPAQREQVLSLGRRSSPTSW